MKYFVRALKEAWRHWPALAGALCCSLGVAALWGLNIAALFPIIETTLHGQSMHAWSASRVQAAQGDLDRVRTELTQAEKELDQLSESKNELNSTDRANLELRVDVLRSRAKAESAGVEWLEWVHPIVCRWLPEKPLGAVMLVVGLVLFGTLLRVLFMLAGAMLVSYISQSIAREVRCKVFDRALALDRAAFNTQGISGFAAHITHTTDMLATGITSFYGGAITEPLRVLSCLTGAWLISWRLTLASLIFAPVAAFLILVLNRRVRALAVKTLDRSLGFHHVILEVFGAIQTVQAYTMEDFERRRFRKATGKLRRVAMQSTLYGALSNPITELLGMGMLCTGLMVSSFLVLNRQTAIFGVPMTDEPLTIPAVTVFFGMLIGAADPLRKLSGVVNGINTGMAAANILYPLLEMRSNLNEAATPRTLAGAPRLIEFRNLTFGYNPVHPVLNGVSFEIETGEHVAIVGPNGGGKSTLVSLLCRFYDPQHGDILIDGVPIRELAIEDLRGRIALVTQQTELFNETIWHNIRYGRWEATDAEVHAAAKLARVDGFVSGFPEGYETIVGPNGQRLSGGQRQRVALARAFLRKADILILDEATSQIDVESERLIHDALAEFGRNRTLIFITHRESTLALATKVVRVECGQVNVLSESAQAA